MQHLPAKTCYLIVDNCINCIVLQCQAPPPRSLKQVKRRKIEAKVPHRKPILPLPALRPTHWLCGWAQSHSPWLSLLPVGGTKRDPLGTMRDPRPRSERKGTNLSICAGGTTKNDSSGSLSLCPCLPVQDHQHPSVTPSGWTASLYKDPSQADIP